MTEPKAEPEREQLTEDERLFVEGICAGMTGVEAARYAGQTDATRRALGAFAAKLRGRRHVQDAIKELRAQHRVDHEDLWTETLRALRELIVDKSNPSARVRACELMARILGKLEPERHDHVVDATPLLSDERRRELLEQLERRRLDAGVSEPGAAEGEGTKPEHN